MAVTVYCNNPGELLENIKSKIGDGNIETWKIDSAGDFTHTPEQWIYQAWMRPKIYEDHLTFIILGSTKMKMSKTVYGIYHGRFIEMLLTHFDRQFTRVYATSLPTSNDIV